jgi:hypothetical protein
MKVRQTALCILLILCFILSGCSKGKVSETTVLPKEQSKRNENDANETTTLKGRYLEKSFALPEGVKADYYYLTKKDNQPVIYCFNDDPCTIIGYQLDQNGTWNDITSPWLKNLSSLPAGWCSLAQVLRDANGYEYLFYTEYVTGGLKGALLCSKDGTTYESIKPEGWEDLDPATGIYNAPAKITILEDGTLAALMYSNEVIIYDATKYKIQNTISDVSYRDSFLSSFGNQLIFCEFNELYTIKAIKVYNLNDNKSVSYPFESNISSLAYCDINNQDILICNTEGIYKMQKDTSVWNCVVDGSLTSLTMPTIWSVGFVSDASENYYVLYNSDAGYSLKQYYFDATVDTLPSKELKIYALTDNTTLRQAIAVFQQKHSDVKVSFTAPMDMYEYVNSNSTTKQDYIRALNTELLTGNSYDIILLDDLPVDSYIEKGVLADMSDILQPMVNDGTLLKNIMDTYLEDGKCYRVPARFTVPLLFGSSPDTKMLTTLKALSEYTQAQAHKDSPIFGSVTVSDLVNTFTPYIINSVLDETNKINRDNLIQALNTLKLLGDSCGIIDENNHSNNESTVIGLNWPENLIKGNYFCLDNIKGFITAMLSFTFTSYVNGDYISFENSFNPYCELGIISNGKQLELSKDFIRTILSEEVQKYDVFDGFPVNSKALLEISLQDRSRYGQEYRATDAEGNEVRIKMQSLDQQQVKELTDICSSVNNRIVKNEYISNIIEEKASDFFTGSLSASDAADAIIQELNIYLSE